MLCRIFFIPATGDAAGRAGGDRLRASDQHHHHVPGTHYPLLFPLHFHHRHHLYDIPLPVSLAEGIACCDPTDGVQIAGAVSVARGMSRINATLKLDAVQPGLLQPCVWRTAFACAMGQSVCVTTWNLVQAGSMLPDVAQQRFDGRGGGTYRSQGNACSLRRLRALSLHFGTSSQPDAMASDRWLLKGLSLQEWEVRLLADLQLLQIWTPW